MIRCAACGHPTGAGFAAVADACPACHAAPFPVLRVATAADFDEQREAGTLNRRARVIADAVTGAKGDDDRRGGLYEMAYRAALTARLSD